MHQLAHAYIALIAASSVLGIFWRVPFSRLQLDRFTWMNVHPVIAGAMLAIAVVLCVAYLVRDVGRAETMLWPRGAYVMALSICSIALVATRTRGSMAAAAAGVVIVTVAAIRRRERLPALVVGAMAALVAAAFVGPTVLAYLSRGATTEELTSLSNRTALWRLAGTLLAERPLTGWGMTASRGLFFDDVGLGGAHNALVNVAVDGGIIVTAFWLGLIGAVLVSLRRLWKATAEVDTILVTGVMATLLVNGLTTEGMGSGNGISALWLLICAAWVGVLQRRRGSVAQRLIVLSSVPQGPEPHESEERGALHAGPGWAAGELAAVRTTALPAAPAPPTRALPPAGIRSTDVALSSNSRVHRGTPGALPPAPEDDAADHDDSRGQ